VLRDSDEWRRPWVDGAAGLPSSPTSSTAWTSPDGPSRPGLSTGSFASSLDGAFDIVEDVAAAPATEYRTSTTSSSSAMPGPQLSPMYGTDLRGPSVIAGGPATRAPRRRTGLLAGVVGGVIGAVLMVAALAALEVVDVSAITGTQAVSTPEPVPAPSPLPDPGARASIIPDVADRVLPTVVRINVSGTASLTDAGALGSGVIYRSDGYIITNHHVIEGANAVEVLLANGDRLEAEIVGSDPLNDLAVLRVARDGLPVIDLRPDGERLRVGETVVAIGSPFGLDATVTSGIISALNRDLRVPGSSDVIPAVIQTDAAINPGNSGGALVDLQGRLVGINTAIMSRSGSNSGVGFAVSVQQAVTSSDQLIAQGFVRYPLLGITGTDVTAQIAESFGLDNRRGAVVDSVVPGSGADTAGMRTRDLIIAVDGSPLRSMADLVAEVRRRVPGDVVSFDVLRGDERLQIDVVLGERPRS